MKCKYKYKYGTNKGKQCPHEAEPGSDYCIWHQKIDGKDFHGKKIKEKNLQESYLVKAKLENAEFKEKTNLSFSNLERAKLDNANLQKADLMFSNLQEASLSDADLQRINLTSAKLFKANLNNSNLQKANLAGVNLQKANVKFAKLQEAHLLVANLQKADLSNVELQESDISNSKLKGINLTLANLENAHITKTDLQSANLTNAILRGIRLRSVNLQEADLTFTDLREANFFEVNLQEADLSASNLTEANLYDANLQGANLSDTQLRNSNFNLANLRNAFLYAAGLKNLRNLKYAKLDKRMIEEDIGDLIFDGGREYNKEEIINDLTLEMNLRILKCDYSLKSPLPKFLREKIEFFFRSDTRFAFPCLSLIKNFYESAQDVYIALKNYFKGEGLYDRSGQYFIGEFRVKGKIYSIQSRMDFYKMYKILSLFFKKFAFWRKEKKLKNINGIYGNFFGILKSFFTNRFNLFVNNLLFITSSYGESPWKIIATSGGIIFAFGLLYFCLRGVAVAVYDNPVNGFWNYIYFSIVTFTTLGYGDFRPIPHMRLVAGSEAFIGAFLLAYFVVVVSRKIMR